MARRFNIGTGWVEISNNLENAVTERALEENETVTQSLTAFVSGDADPAEYDSLSEDGEDGE